MVYGGKPSTGCKNCKKRKIKCDEATPACYQCTSTKRTCPGYVQYFDLVFRDQTQAVQRKAERKRLKDKRSISPEDSASTTSTSFEENPVTIPEQRIIAPRPFIDPSPALGLGQTPEQLAICQFFTNFVLVPTHPDAQCGFLDSLLPLYTSTRHDSMLSLATSAVALAVAGSEPDRRLAYLLGRAILGDALRKTTAALQDPVQSVQDETLMTVMLMGFYERINTAAMGTNPTGLHDAGALTLLKHREKMRYTSELSVKLALAAQTQAVNSSFSFTGLSKEQAAGLTDLASKVPQNVANQLIPISAKAADLRGIARIVFGNPQSPASEHEIDRILYLALDIDSQLKQWAETVPDAWLWVSATGFDLPSNMPRETFIYNDRVDYYCDLSVLDIWNSYRAKRVMILSIITECILKTGPPYDEFLAHQAKYAFRTMQELVDDLCATVPYSIGTKMFGGARDQEFVEYPYISVKKFTIAQRRHVAALGGWYLLENIKGCLSAVRVCPIQRRWLMRVMVRIGNIYNIRSPAVVLRDTLHDALRDMHEGEDKMEIITQREEFIHAIKVAEICTDPSEDNPFIKMTKF